MSNQPVFDTAPPPTLDEVAVTGKRPLHEGFFWWTVEEVVMFGCFNRLRRKLGEPT